MRPSYFLASAAIALTLIGAGCLESPADEFRNAIPRPDQLSIDVPEGGGGSGSVGSTTSALLGDRAVLYQVTHDVSYVINGGIYVVLSIIDDIASYPPTEIDENRAVWGPFTPTLSPITYQLVAEQVGESSYNYALLARNRASTSDEDFVPVLAGNSIVSSEHEIAGTLAIDLDAVQSVDPAGDHGTGQVVAAYDTSSEPRFVEVAFENWSTRLIDEPVDGVYRYTENADQSGTFVFGVETNIFDGPAAETLVVTSRWTAGGAGRGDAVAGGGDVPAGFKGLASECWDDSFGRTYYSDNLGSEDEGSDEACVFLAPLWEE